jgi:hypothetical protein
MKGRPEIRRQQTDDFLIKDNARLRRAGRTAKRDNLILISVWVIRLE